MTNVTMTVGQADEALDQRLDEELDSFNASATSDVSPPQELTVRAEHDGRLVGGLSGWTWGLAAAIAMMWVEEERRGTGLGVALISAFENEAQMRGCSHIFVTSFTFQAPGFYQRLGYREFSRWRSVPIAGRDDVHMYKKL